MAVGATDMSEGRPAPLRIYDSWWTLCAAALGAALLLTGGLWVSTHLRTDPALHDAALFVHLASLVLGFGAVLSADWYGALWLTGRCSPGRGHRRHRPPAHPDLGRAGRLAWSSGVMLHPDLGSPLTQTKLALVLILTVNGFQAGALGERLVAHQAAAGPDGAPAAVPVPLLVRCAATAGLSQICWWGAA